eukprot:TRINITY_DN67805_c0_g1_i1.p1 TRINITY_DN67805_c0_g1~~TRINITY_DN67805_c0_g1_i1.p1  ORF type:complete len:100 (+),score=15.30 TRINITY_DN67805_c0_g1_i1:39-302(+)
MIMAMGTRKTCSFEGWLDLMMGVMVVLNAIILVVQSQAQGAQANASLGLSSDNGAREVEHVCDVIDQVFIIVYVAELVARIFILRKR